MVAVTRPLAQSIAEAADPDRWLNALTERYPPGDIVRLRQALDWVAVLYGHKQHEDTGSSLFQHAVASASIVADLRLDANSVIATLLFALPGIQAQPLEQINTHFGPDITRLVDGATKVSQLRSLAHPTGGKPQDVAKQIEAVRKMLIAMVEDIRAVLIKLAWRTQTMHELARAPEEVRRRIAQETLDLFAPLANRLGVWQIKWELEDLGFRYLHPDTYKKIAKLIITIFIF